MSPCNCLERLCFVALFVTVLSPCFPVRAISQAGGVASLSEHKLRKEHTRTLSLAAYDGSTNDSFGNSYYNPVPKPPDSGLEPFLILPQNGIFGSYGTTENGHSSQMLVMGYYPDWVSSSFPPEKINFKWFDWIDFAFAVPSDDYTLLWDEPGGAPALLKRLIASAHSQGTKVKLSIGGWTGSKHFSSAVANDTSRKTFVNNILATYMTYELDGIDIDWEYPGREGSPGNEFGPDDTTNFLLFLQRLRAALPLDARITAAVEPTPFLDDKGRPMDDVSTFAEVLDWVLIMNYDVWGSSSSPGPNAPFYDGCGNSTQPEASAVGSFNAWTAAGFPARKLVLGLPSYGYISSSSAKSLKTRSKQPSKKQRHSLKVVNEDGGSDGQVQFRDLIIQGALLSTNDTIRYASSGGFVRLWDSCSSTPYLRSSSSNQIITYDGPISLGMKAAFAKAVGMLGVNIFDIHGDTDDGDLMNGVRKSMGLS
ncbi:hypothetical protein GALMADRAFT_235912 [Galerina marginata CBS 339.88]|uniref:GH18 domain-containing protein n=1 Tax=Galerina marginata (strain CBS 339.88) TaxID=685588 RepID=A0A067TKE7_GALM3|nr:hypothetical protein GALMADRAFT_235912 [Galerina marginata CBS 339.88]